jgi:hypothetical protein
MQGPCELWFFLLVRQLLFDAPFDLAMITLRLGFCATLFDPVHDIVVFVAVAVGPFATQLVNFSVLALGGWSHFTLGISLKL